MKGTTGERVTLIRRRLAAEKRKKQPVSSTGRKLTSDWWFRVTGEPKEDGATAAVFIDLLEPAPTEDDLHWLNDLFAELCQLVVSNAEHGNAIVKAIGHGSYVVLFFR